MSPLLDTFMELSPRDRTALGMIALLPRGVSAGTLETLFRIASLNAGKGADSLRHADLYRRLNLAGIPLADTAAPSLAVNDPQMRRVAIDWLVSSGLARRWAADFNSGQINRLWNAFYFAEVPQPIELGIALATLGGSSVADLRDACARLGDHLAVSVLQRAGANLLLRPLDDTQVNRLHPSVQLALGADQLELGLRQPQPELGYWYRRVCALSREFEVNTDRLPVLYQLALLRQDPQALKEHTPALTFARTPGLNQAMLMPDARQALVILQAAYDAQPAVRGPHRQPLPGVLGVTHALALAAHPDKAGMAQLAKLQRAAEQTADPATTHCIRIVHEHAKRRAEAQPWSWSQDGQHPLFELWVLLVLDHWSGNPSSEVLRAQAAQLLPILRDAGWDWMAEHFTAAQAHAAAEIQPRGSWLWVQPEAPWQRALRAIESFSREDQSSAERHSRIRASMRPDHGDWVEVELRELKPLAKGGYSSGRRLDPGRSVFDVVNRLDPQDLPARALLALWEHQDSYSYAPDDPLVNELLNYPHLVNDRDQPLQVRRLTPRLRIEQKGDHSRVQVQIDPAVPRSGHRLLRWMDRELEVTDFDARTLALAHSLAGSTEFPQDAIPALLALTPQLGRYIAIETDVGSAQTIEDLDPGIHVLLEPLREGLRLRLRTRPMGETGAYLVPAAGTIETLGLRDGQPVRGRRDLAAEQQRLQDVLDAVPTLAGAELGDALDLSDPEVALETLAHLQELGDRITLNWSDHKRWSLSRTRSSAQLSLKVSSQRDWFAAEGGLTLDDGQVVSLASLLEALPSSQGRFVRLSGERVIALSNDLARQLRQLQALTDHKGRLQLPVMAAPMLQPLLDSGAEVELDDAFKAQLQRIAAAEHVQQEVPADLQAELRDYQIEGYHWMLRLASWGAGACLADDMGLGKTLQSLAVLLARAGQGPALVVAPTSVVPNWRNETRRFAPSLEVRVYGEGQREQVLEQLGPGCVVLVSYGLLTLNIEAFAQVRFATLVLDEAQAIKNAAAQRSQAMRQLQADFRIATTGTPIENHLGELWSLMRVLNPGLLGSQEHFNKRFMAPIEREPRGPERDTLRRLIAPFILRRLKSQVLSELPPRTEIVLTVQPGEAEARLLAAVRLQAIENIGKVVDNGDSTQRFNVLAQIMRLRRAACHPSLVAPELNLPGAKLEQLLELMTELRENRHRALVFSQFVDYLDIVRAAFDQAGISYQYLDGSTPPKAREAAVNAFQSGQGQAFLLSLKAGGTGLNLTAADYVIHLDPWWNPAVEQQATDRAHRIGQTRPVTVYKLVVAGSIEEQILALHGNKREIADSILADQDGGSRMSVNELIGLLRAEL